MVFRTFALPLTLVLMLSATHARGQDVSRAPDHGKLTEITVFAPRLMETRSVASVPSEDTSGSDNATLEQLTVRRERPLAAYRLALEASRDRIFDIFNEINSDAELDIHCRTERRTGSRIPKRVCRPDFSRDVLSKAAGEYAAVLKSRCDDGSQECIFGNASAAQTAMSRAQAVESEEHYKHLVLAEEIQRLAQESSRLYRALLRHAQLEREYQKARERPRDE